MKTPRFRQFYAILFALSALSAVSLGQHQHPAPLPVPNSKAKTEKEMKPYSELIEHTRVKIAMVPIRGGTFMMGSPAGEKHRGQDEGPQHKVKIAPFWMAKYEITWDAFEVWKSDLDIIRRNLRNAKITVRDKLADEFQLTQPTPPYTDMSFGMGKRKYPAICMTQLAARTYCQWLTMKTGRYYRLPTEAEWEYACRAGTTTAYHFGDPARIDEYAWHAKNTGGKYHKVGTRKPNPWGLFDMHGNVAEWVLDQHTTSFYSKFGKGLAVNPLAIPKTIYPRVVRGGSWKQPPAQLRSAARLASNEDWKEQDPQEPQSIWYHTDAVYVGFRIVRPLVQPSARERATKWDKSEPVQERIEKETDDESDDKEEKKDKKEKKD